MHHSIYESHSTSSFQVTPRRERHVFFHAIAAVFIGAVACVQAEASVILVAEEIGSDMRVTLSGSIDKSSLGTMGSTFYNYDANFSFYVIEFGNGQESSGLWGPVTGPESFSNSGMPATSYTGTDRFAFSTGYVVLPDSYVSGTPLAGTQTYTGMSFALCGWTSGENRVWNLPGSQTVTLQVVPEPSSYAMALAGIACAGWGVWRRRKRA